jgi:hypothetical protein
MEAAGTSETSINYQTTQHNLPEDSHVIFIVAAVRT